LDKEEKQEKTAMGVAVFEKGELGQLGMPDAGVVSHWRLYPNPSR
jgi:hypothetical protein